MNKHKEDLWWIYEKKNNEEIIDLSSKTVTQISQIIWWHNPNHFDLLDNIVICPNCGENYCENWDYCEQCNNCNIDKLPKEKQKELVNKNYNWVELKKIWPNNSYIILKYGEKRQLKIYLENVQFREKEIDIYDWTSEKQEIRIKIVSFKIKSIQKKVHTWYNERENFSIAEFKKVRDAIEFFLLNK
jgi:hypothetical protein